MDAQEERSCAKNLEFFDRNWLECKFINKCLSREKARMPRSEEQGGMAVWF